MPKSAIKSRITNLFDFEILRIATVYPAELEMELSLQLRYTKPWLWLGLMLVLICFATAQPVDDDQTDASKKIAKLDRQYQAYIKAVIKTRQIGCTAENIRYRQEWESLSKRARRDYIKAVRCLQRKAPKTSKADVPGVQSRYDDFTAIHLQQAPFIHWSGLFLAYHRYFVWSYEQALRTECGYTGAQPYWDWTLSWQDPSSSPVFDGTSTSLGSNGKFVSGRNTTPVTVFGETVTIPPATGGGCVERGPFRKGTYTVSLGPVVNPGPLPPGPDGGFGANPRCLLRDLSPAQTNYTKPTDVFKLLTACGKSETETEIDPTTMRPYVNSLACWDARMEGVNGVHNGGHFGIVGQYVDPFTSSNDPAFWLHHAQVDRMWSIWQALGKGRRDNLVWGTRTAFNRPPSANVSRNTVMDFGTVSTEVVRVGDVGSTVDGPLCYMYI